MTQSKRDELHSLLLGQAGRYLQAGGSSEWLRAAEAELARRRFCQLATEVGMAEVFDAGVSMVAATTMSLLSAARPECDPVVIGEAIERVARSMRATPDRPRLELVPIP